MSPRKEQLEILLSMFCEGVRLYPAMQLAEYSTNVDYEYGKMTCIDHSLALYIMKKCEELNVEWDRKWNVR